MVVGGGVPKLYVRNVKKNEKYINVPLGLLGSIDNGKIADTVRI